MAECVQVAVSNATFHFDKLYSYSVPAHLQDRVFVGSMVLVPFGRGAAARMGVVLGLDAPEAAGKRLKSLYDAAPEQARLSEELLRLVYYLKEHTFCTYYEAVKAIIPYGAQYKACLLYTSKGRAEDVSVSMERRYLMNRECRRRLRTCVPIGKMVSYNIRWIKFTPQNAPAVRRGRKGRDIA